MFLFAYIFIALLLTAFVVSSVITIDKTGQYVGKKYSVATTYMNVVYGELKIRITNPVINSIINSLKDRGYTFEYKKDATLFEEGKIPLGGVLLLEGKIDIFDGDKKTLSVGPNHIIGLDDLLNNQPLKFSAVIKAGSKIVLISKSEVIDKIGGTGSTWYHT